MESYLKDFNDLMDTFIHSIKIAPLDSLLDEFVSSIPKFENDSLKTEFYQIMGKLVKDHIKSHNYRYDFPEKVRSMEFQTPFIYIYQKKITR